MFKLKKLLGFAPSTQKNSLQIPRGSGGEGERGWVRWAGGESHDLPCPALFRTAGPWVSLAGTGPSLEPGRKGMSEEQEEYTATEPCQALAPCLPQGRKLRNVLQSSKTTCLSQGSACLFPFFLEGKPSSKISASHTWKALDR